MENLWNFMKENAFILLAALTVGILAKYIHGRKKNLALMREVSSKLEHVFEPAWKEYTMIGGLAGFKAAFKLQRGVELNVTLVMRPRHSLLYLPISMLLFGGDRLFLVFKPSSLAGDEETFRKMRMMAQRPGFAAVRHAALLPEGGAASFSADPHDPGLEAFLVDLRAIVESSQL